MVGDEPPAGFVPPPVTPDPNTGSRPEPPPTGQEPPPGPPPPGQGGGPLAWNPQLVRHPLGRFTDAQYEIDEQDLYNDTLRKYQDVLRDLGFMSDSGQLMEGEVDMQANTDRANLNRELSLTGERVTNEQRDLGTLFSGLRAVAQAREEHPIVQSLADLDINTPKQKSQLYSDALDILSDYATGQNRLLLEAAGRYDSNNPTGPPEPSDPYIPGSESASAATPAGQRRYQGAVRKAVRSQTKSALKPKKPKKPKGKGGSQP